MAPIRNQTPTSAAPRDLADRLALANALYREYHTRCFWHCPRDLTITEELLPLVVKGLRSHGGRRGFLLAAKLLPPVPSPSREPPECR